MPAALTDGSDLEIVAYLQTHRAQLGSDPPAITYKALTWSKWLPDDLKSLPEQFGGTITISNLVELSARPASDTARRRLFTAALIWGRGTKNARLLPGFITALNDAALPATLKQTTVLIRKGWSAEAYEVWQEADIPGLGEPFFTKWFFAAGLHGLDVAAPAPLVLDGNVWRSLRALGWSSETTTGRRWRTRPSAAYAAYNAAVRRWADALSLIDAPVTSLGVEQLLFRTNGSFER